MKPFRILMVVGARPQFVKVAAISRAVAARDDIEEILLHTGQHFDAAMSRVFFDELGIPAPRINLDIHGGSHGEMTGRMLAGIEEAILAEHPDIVLVPGDTNSALAGALAAAKLHVPVAHLEAGLRSFNRRMPEEINRVLIDHLSALLLCPTETAITNLHRESIVAGVHHIGDVMYDATLFAAARSRGSNVLARLELLEGSYAVATVHRAESTDDRNSLTAILKFLSSVRAKLPWCCRSTPAPHSKSRAGGWISTHWSSASRSAISICIACSSRLPRSIPIRGDCRGRRISTAFPASPCAARPNG